MKNNNSKRLNVLAETEDFLAIDKPSGLLVVSDRWDQEKDTLVGWVRTYVGSSAWAVHRLDRDASGVVLFAKTPLSRNFLEKQFREKKVSKIYHAFIQGDIIENSGEIDLSLSDDPKKPGRMRAGGKNSKSSQTTFEVLERFKGVAYLKVIPKTGRQHQIRVHLNSLGYPVLCDGLYGSGRPYYLSELKRFYKHKKEELEKPLMGRLALHASELSFLDTHGKQRTLQSPLPKDFVVFLKYLKKFWGV